MKANDKKTIFSMMWQFIKNNGYTRSEALKCAWANFKLKMKMSIGECKFYYKKVNGEIREAHGTLIRATTTEGESKRKKNEVVQVYYDTEKNEWRSYRKENLIFA